MSTEPTSDADISGSIERWKAVFGLGEYRTFLSDKPLKRKASGHVRVEAEYLRATFRIAPDLSGKELEETVSHEMAHVFLGEFAQWANTVLEYVDKRERDPLFDGWDLAWERSTERLARLVRKLHERD